MTTLNTSFSLEESIRKSFILSIQAHPSYGMNKHAEVQELAQRLVEQLRRGEAVWQPGGMYLTHYQIFLFILDEYNVKGSARAEMEKLFYRTGTKE